MLQTLLTACPLDCPDSCSLHVDVEDGRLLRVDAAPVGIAANAFTQGFICKKVKHHADRVYGPDRVLTPIVRVGPKGSGSFRPVSWDEAMSLIADRLRECLDGPHGPAGIVPYLYNSSAGLAAGSSIGPELFERLGASSVPHTICAATSGAAIRAIVGDMLLGDPTDVAHSDAVVVWGANPSVSNTHLPPLINTAKRSNGARVIVIDPRATAMARRADVHLAVRPGTDAILAMALVAELDRRCVLDLDFISAHTTGWTTFVDVCRVWSLDAAADRCGIELSAIDAVVAILADAQRPFFRLGWGMERNHNGAAAIGSVLGLRLAIGRFGQRGSGAALSTGAAMPWDAQAFRTGPANSLTRRQVNQNLLGAMLCDASLEPAIRVLFVQGANPAVMNPDQAAVLRGLAREDLFTVVHDQVLTDTARWADVVLPATTHFEAADAAGSYGSLVVQPFPAVIDRVGESRTNVEVIADLALRLSVDLGATDVASLLHRGLGPYAEGSRAVREAGRSVAFVDSFPSFPDHRARFPRPVFEALPADPHPLTLLSPASPRAINSIFGEGAHVPVITIHPADAAARGIEDGSRVAVFNGLGSIEVTAHVDAETRPGVVVLPKGDWSRNYGSSGYTVNVLTPASIEPTVGGACFNDARVEVTAL